MTYRNGYEPSPATILSIAQSYREAGISLIPIKADGSKAPAGPLPEVYDENKGQFRRSWDPLKERLPTDTEMTRWFSGNGATGIGGVMGAVSGNRETIDFDEGSLFEPFMDEVRERDPELAGKLTIHKTPRPAFHVTYCCEVVERNQALAKTADGKKKRIETRGEGGYILLPGSAAQCHESGRLYEHHAGPPITEAATITTAQRALLFDIARSFNQFVPNEPLSVTERARRYVTNCPPAISGQCGHDKTFSVACSLVLGFDLSVNDALPIMQEYNATCQPPWSEAELLHKLNDADKKPDARGYLLNGRANTVKPSPRTEPAMITDDEPKPEIVEVRELILDNPDLNEPIIDGLLRRGEVGNIIAPPKYGKSWLVYGIALSLACGLKIFRTFFCSARRVLIIDNELHPSTLAYRIQKVARAMKLAPEQYQGRIHVLSVRGRLLDLNGVAGVLEHIKRGTYDLVILDALYRAIPAGLSENDNAAVAGMYNLIDQLAKRLGCAWLNVHHSSKGNQDGKAVTDVGAGAGAQSRAVDAHIILRAHEARDHVVLDAAVRSFPPLQEPLTLQWTPPLWDLSCLDPTKLKGRKSALEEMQRRKDADGMERLLEAITVEPGTINDLTRRTGISRERQNRLLGMLEAAKKVRTESVKVKGKDCLRYHPLDQVGE